MADRRTKRQKLEAMAQQNVSPNEAAIAGRILAEEDMRASGHSDEEVTKALANNPYGDILFMKMDWGPKRGQWVPLWTSNHFPDDEVPPEIEG